MNTPANRLTHAVMIAAALAAVFMIQQAKAAPANAGPAASSKAAQVITLPRVVVTGKRVQPTQIVLLPRVVVTGKRVDRTDNMQARKDSKPTAALIAMR